MLDDDYVRGNPEVGARRLCRALRLRYRQRHDAGGDGPGVRAVLHHQGRGKGSGLGLSMVYGFARQSKGHVKIYSEPGRGTTVRLYLPRAAVKTTAPPQPSRDPLQPAGPNERILVVEDNTEVRADRRCGSSATSATTRSRPGGKEADRYPAQRRTRRSACSATW